MVAMVTRHCDPILTPGVLLQEVEALLSENEMLQGKLHSQEDDFRLQNSTLMAELSKVGRATSVRPEVT